jgi:hypothetical protein
VKEERVPIVVRDLDDGGVKVRMMSPSGVEISKLVSGGEVLRQCSVGTQYVRDM